MEIEAKFSIPDARAARQLQALDALGAFTLVAPRILKMRDTFFDTPARDLRRARHVLRVRRRSDGKQFVTLKAPTQKSGAVFRRPETEVEIYFARSPKQLTRALLPMRIAKLVAPLGGDARLYPLFSITQTRQVRALKNGRRVIGEWSVDRVTFRAGARRRVFYELEIELKRTGTEKELAASIAALQKIMQLEPQRRGKFERALEFYEMQK
ncbi:MAG: hypothetical protein DCC52_08500 [Chloroflexi bacterium]|nr:MAG: hypothetical protein DCC52_08500 [Chloroflexota bacterium]